jgi:1-acyl-sn-glycerol-3-phosphate acyltransferase
VTPLVQLLYRIAVWITIVSSTVLFGLPAMFAALLPPRGDWFTLFARGWARTILFVTGVQVQVLHRERLVPGKSFVIVANHSSLSDILVLFVGLPVQIRFMAKRSVFRVPFLGWGIAAAGFIPVDRGDTVRGRIAVDVALKRLQAGRSVVVFPEETRSLDGELLAFKKGAALVALKAGLPILPIAILGTAHVLPRGSMRASPGTVVLAVGEEIPTQGKSANDRAELTQAARGAIERLRKEAAAAVIT